MTMRYGSAYWDQRAKDRWAEDAHGAFGDTDAMLRAHQNLRRVLAARGMEPVERIIELGCGFGASYPTIREFLPSALYLGMDCCTPYVKEAQERFPKEDFFVGDAATWIPPLRADLVIAVATISSLESQWPDIIQHIFGSWLRPGGQLLVAEENWFSVFRGPL